MNSTNTQARVSNIAVLTDFSPCSSSAMNHAIRLAAASGAKVILVHAIEPWTYAYFPGEEMEQQLTDRARWNMLREEARLSEVRHEVIVQQGTPWEVLRQVMEAQHVDLAVLGTIGAVGFHNDEVLGSTAQQIIRNAPCPVLSIGSEVAVKETFPTLTQILFPTDLSGKAPHAASYAGLLAERYHAHLALMHVLPGHQPPQSDEAEWLKEPYRRRLGAVARESLALPSPPDCLVEFAETPAQAILKAACELPADLIVMGRVHRNGHKNGRIHNSLRILAQAPCPVLTIPEKDGHALGRHEWDGFYVGQPETLQPSSCVL